MVKSEPFVISFYLDELLIEDWECKEDQDMKIESLLCLLLNYYVSKQDVLTKTTTGTAAGNKTGTLSAV